MDVSRDPFPFYGGWGAACDVTGPGGQIPLGVSVTMLGYFKRCPHGSLVSLGRPLLFDSFVEGIGDRAQAGQTRLGVRVFQDPSYHRGKKATIRQQAKNGLKNVTPQVV